MTDSFTPQDAADIRPPSRGRNVRFDFKFLLSLTAAVAFVSFVVQFFLYAGAPAGATLSIVVPWSVGSTIGIVQMAKRQRSWLIGGMLGGGAALLIHPGLSFLCLYPPDSPLAERLLRVAYAVGLGMGGGAILSGVFGVFRMRCTSGGDSP